jgi:hypothetical protein
LSSRFAFQKYALSWLATSCRSWSVTCMYRFFIDSVDQPMTVRSGTPRLQDRRCGVPGVVQARIPNTCLAEQLLPVVVIAPGIDRLPVRLGEHPAAFLPLGSSVLTLSFLYLLVQDDQVKQLVGQRQRPAASRRLHVDFHQSPAMTVRLLDCVFHAVRLARVRARAGVPIAWLLAFLRTVIHCRTGAGVIASVLPGMTLETLLYSQHFRSAI